MSPVVIGNLLHFAVIELLKHRALYTIHAAALVKDRLGVLIPGASGQGKSTCCVSLLRVGYRCLSDDHPLLRDGQAGVEAVGFPGMLHVTPKTVGFFPELRSSQLNLHLGALKYRIRVEDVFASGTAARCRPSLILFPEIVPGQKSRLLPLTREEALRRLLQHGFLISSKAVARHQFQTLVRLTGQAACFRLLFGNDPAELPSLIEQYTTQSYAQA